MWKKKGVDTWFHIRMVAVSTCFYVERVEKILLPTSNRALNYVATPKHNFLLKQTCGVP
ncbi:MAG: hypothetical protein M1540_08335 [Candidatus Bathyarchaeota archaeon]|nr:hypothetical protein [Candidatus Bathyarchaeota archaeon]